MSKNNLENVSDKARGKKEALKKVAEELELLRGQVGALADRPAVEALMEVMMRIDLNLDQASKNIQNERKFGMYKDNADKAMAEARARIQSLGGGRSRKPASPKPKEDDGKKQDPKILDSQASKTSVESRGKENIFNDVERSLQTFLAVVKDLRLETEDEEAIKAFEARRDELEELATDPKLTSIEQNKNLQDKCLQFILDLGLLLSKIEARVKAEEKQPEPPESKQEIHQEEEKNGKDDFEKAQAALKEFFAGAKKANLIVGRKHIDDLNRKLKDLGKLTAPGQYENFRNKYQEFKAGLERLLSQLEEQAKTKKAELADSQSKQELQTTVKTDTQEQKDQEERDSKYEKCEEEFELLGSIIEEADGNEKGKRKLIDKYDTQMKALRGYLQAADDTEIDSKAFWTNINNFNNGFKKLLKDLEPDLKEAFENGGVLSTEEKPVEKEVKPVVKENQEKKTNVQEQMKFVQERKEKVRLLERILKQIHDNQGKNYNFNETNSSTKIDVVLELLAIAEKNLSDNDLVAYKKNIDEAISKTREVWDTIPKNIKQDVTKEYDNRVAGKETAGTAQERMEHEEALKKWEDALATIEEMMDEKDKNLRLKCASELKVAKDSLLEAQKSFVNADVYEESLDKLGRAISSLMKATGLTNEYYTRLAGATKREVAAETVAQKKQQEAPVPAEKRVTAKFNVTEVQQAVIDRLSSTEGMVPVSTAVLEPEVEPKKKGLWKRFKEGVKGVFNRETGKVAGKVTYETVASVLGIKIITDAIRAVGGKGDIADWWRGRKESKQTLESIAAAQKSMTEIFDQAKNNKSLAETEKTKGRIAEFKKQLESPGLPPEIRQALSEKLKAFEEENQEKLEQAKKERDEEIRRVMEVYEERKVSGLKIARDAMNFALTVTGFSMLRGLMYGTVSVFERIKKAKKKHAKEAAEKKFSYKDVMVDAAVETAHGLSVGLFSKEKLGAKRRTINLLKSLGTVARGLGIGSLAVSGAELPQHSLDKLIASIKEQGVASTISDNYIQNANHVWENAERVGHVAERVGHVVANPTEITEVFDRKGTILPQGTEQPAPMAEAPEVHAPAEVPAEFSTDQFAAEHGLSPEFARSMDSLVHQYPELNNPQSMERILDASQVGGGAHSHHEIIKSKIDTLDESGGHRRQVIFEELLNQGHPESAANYLQSQNFSSRHLGYLSKYNVDKDSPDSYLKFAQQYDQNDNKMVYGLFRAMQGKESTTLANAGLEGNGVDSHVRGKVHYFGLDNKKPILSGGGEVRVIQETSGASNKVGAAAQNEGLSTDDKLWANANVIRSMKGDAGYDGSSANAPASEMSAEERSVLAEVEADKERFARLGERHIDIVDTARSGKPVGEYINSTVQPEAPGAEPAVTENVVTRKVINTYKASESVSVTGSRAGVSPIESKPIVSEVEKPLPAETPIVSEPYADAPLNQFLKEHGSNQKEFFDTLEDMRAETAMQFDNSLISTEGGHKFLQEKINEMYSSQEHYRDVLQSGATINKDDLKDINKLLQIQESYQSGQSDWMKDWSKAMFNKDDNKAIELALASHPNANTEPMLTNNSHAVRIWDSNKKKDVFWYEESATFNLDKDGNLVIKDETGEHIMSKKDALEKARE